MTKTTCKTTCTSVSTSEMLPTMFSPKTCRHFIVRFDGIDSFTVKKLDVPTLQTDKAGLYSNLPAKLHLHCPIAPSVEIQVQDAVNKQTNGQLKDCVVDIIDSAGSKVSKWVFVDTKIVAIDMNSFDYSTSDLLQCTISFTFSSLKFEY